MSNTREAAAGVAPRPTSDADAAGPAPLSLWRHRKRGTTYIVVGVSTRSTSGPGEGTRSVVYRCLATGTLWDRELAEFLDGRFEPITRPGACA